MTTDTISNLAQLPPNKCATVQNINIYTPLRRRLFELGLVCGSEVECVLKSPSGNPKAYLICGAVIAIRNEDAKKIECQLKCSG